MQKHFALAALAGLALRGFFLWSFPAEAGDSPTYEALARNWLDHGVYGLFMQGRLVPVDLRLPGYSAFLACVYTLFGRSRLAVMATQALVDLASCFLIVALAARIFPAVPAADEQRARARAASAAIWLAALCPFTANYAAVVLSEVLAVFLTTLALLLLLCAWDFEEDSHGPLRSRRGRWFAAGLVVGLGTLVRPETPLLLVAAALVLAISWRRRGEWGKLARAGVWLAAGLLLPLLPWAVRNRVVLGETQILAPRYAQLRSEYVPRGFYEWTATWLVRFRDVYLAPWKVEEEPIDIDDLPAAAFDSPGERARVVQLLEEYNETLTVSPQVDAQFAELGRERTRRHPLRTYLWVPLGRMATLWFTPRIELLPFSGDLWPLAEKFEDDKTDFLVTVTLGTLNVFYVGLALGGVYLAMRGRPRAQSPPGNRAAAYRGVALLVVFILVRTLYLTQVETPEPRYVLVCYPAVIALGSLVALVL